MRVAVNHFTNKFNYMEQPNTGIGYNEKAELVRTFIKHKQNDAHNLLSDESNDILRV